MTRFFADTYAILAFLAGDEAYARRWRGSDFRTGLLQVYEALRAQLNLEVSADEAERNVAPFEAVALPPEPVDLRAAARWLAAPRRDRRALDAVDAVGLAQARRLGLPLLTGDPAFRGMEGVEFLPPAGRPARPRA